MGFKINVDRFGFAKEPKPEKNSRDYAAQLAKKLVDREAIVRTNKDEVLLGKITAESDARTADIEQLREETDRKLAAEVIERNSAITLEANIRSAKDAELEGKINNALTEAITYASNAVGQEEELRTERDGELRAAIEAEVSSREQLEEVVNDKVDKVEGLGLSSASNVMEFNSKPYVLLEMLDGTFGRMTELKIYEKKTIDDMLGSVTGNLFELMTLEEFSNLQSNNVPYEEYEGKAIEALAMAVYNEMLKDHVYRIEVLENQIGSGGSSVDKISTFTPIPERIDVSTNSEFRLYFRNILPKDNLKFWIYNNPGNDSKLTTYYYDDYLLIKPTADGTYTLPWKVFDINSDVIDEGTLAINAQSTVPKNISVLVLGDSTVNAGVMTQELLDLYSANNATVTLLGTRGTAPNFHEGRGGWTAEGYCTKESDTANGTNPFYNNGFDFSYYMENQGYTDLSAVVIQLGINDIFKYRQNNGDKYNSASALNYFRQIIDSILAYNNTIKIILNLPITPNSNGTSFTQTYKTNQIYWVYNENIIRFAKELMNHFAANPNIVISASNCILDTKTDIRDGVHPTDDGYKKLGGRLYQVLKNNVTMPEMDLLNLSGRTLVNNGKNVATTDIHELNDSCVYKSAFSGVRNIAYDTEISYELISSNSFKVSSNHADGGRGAGVEFPITNLESGSYKFNYTIEDSYLRCYLMKYNSDTTFNSWTEFSSAPGTFAKTINVEDGYLYSIVFCPVKNHSGEGIVSNISLTKN